MARLVIREGLCVLTCASAVLLAVVAGGCGVDGQVPRAPGFHATVYETQLGSGQAAQLDAAELNARAAKGESLRDILTKLGRTKVVYRIYHPIGSDCDCQTTVGARVPRIRSSRVGPGRMRRNLVTYERVGAIFKVHTQPAPDREDGKLHVRLNAELAVPGRAGPRVAPGVRSPTMRGVRMSYNGLAEIGRPFVAVSVDGSSADGGAPLTAYVCRIVVAPAAASRSSSASRAGSPPSAGDFDATVYRLKLPAGRAEGIDVEALAGAADAEELRTRLQKLGQATVLYHAGQPVSLTSESVIQVGARKPFVTATRLSEAGMPIDTVRYEHVGAIFRVAPEPIADRAAQTVRIRLNAELSDLVESNAEVAKGVRAPVVRSATLTYVGGLDVGRPFVAVCLDASSAEKKEDAVAYVCRVVLSNLR